MDGGQVRTERGGWTPLRNMPEACCMHTCTFSSITGQTSGSGSITISERLQVQRGAKRLLRVDHKGSTSMEKLDSVGFYCIPTLFPKGFEAASHKHWYFYRHSLVKKHRYVLKLEAR